MAAASIPPAAPPSAPLHLALGMFDGVHVGHQAVIGLAVAAAKAAGGSAGVLTFWPHPSRLFRPEAATPMLQEATAKAERLRGLGVDTVVTQEFDAAFARIEAADFLPWLQRRFPGLAAVYVGENFRFGRGRAGDVAQLQAAGHAAGIPVVAAPRIQRDGEPVSSTRIRGLLAEGRMAEVNRLLGWTYAAEGNVQPGKRLGRTIGFPTLNLPWQPEAAPRLGVYAVRVSGAAGAEGLPAVANYGLRPTVEQTVVPRIEAHVLGVCPFGEGARLKVEWLHFLRPEMKFAGLPELRAQIARDVQAAREFFTAKE